MTKAGAHVRASGHISSQEERAVWQGPMVTLKDKILMT
jgi:hypothetical protein